jgi:hypothetical protein
MNNKFFLFDSFRPVGPAGGCNGKNCRRAVYEEQMMQIPLANTYNLPPASAAWCWRVIQTLSELMISWPLREGTPSAAAKMDKEAFDARAIPYIREAVRGKVTDILVYQEAVKQAPDNIEENLEKAINTETSRFIASYNNNYALAEKKIKEMGMDWRSFRDYQKKLIMTQSYVSTTLKEDRRFSYQELTDYYNRVRAEQFCETGIVEFSLMIIIRLN